MRFPSLLTLVFIFIISFTCSKTRKVKSCVCSDSSLCSKEIRKFSREKVVVAEGTSDHTKWPWSQITTVIATKDVPNRTAQKLMCTAHKNKANFAFIEKVPVITNTSDPRLQKWLNTVAAKRDLLYVDYVALDLLDLLGQCTADSTHVQEVLGLLTYMVKNYFFPHSAELLCIVPYKPPCYNGDCSLAKYLTEHCVAFITSPESFFTCDTNTNCIAKATMPMTSLVYGVEEYIDHGISPDKLLIGIPWHGYDYTCSNSTIQKKTGGKEALTCYFDKKNDSSTCDTSKRKKISLAEIKGNYSEQYRNAKAHHYHPIYRSDYINIMINHVQHQLWYEGHDSLLDKYMYIRSMQFKGMVIWTGDDLSRKGVEDDTEWNWILHSLFSEGEIQEHNLNMAGTVAGISVGCFILGSLLGFAVGCGLMRKRMRNKGLRLPFQRDEEETDFHDDDNAL
ncbi:di-N-acetylchitobiase-like isoform X2 [Saccostrea echinata]|uniref:di-N-acetylchitobiase-like isoform X2 n=1 Tax=Saccostrea echinata TaxID=191078 RepID=UPI002A7EEADF|nr:di-N-acetylchitobiase-like isoform X2 [Saccostrea echinata]